MIIVPVILVKNEEYWIRHVLSALTAVFPNVIVADTGSSDQTIEEISKVPGPGILFVKQYNGLTPHDIGQARQWMQDEAKDRYGATHIFLVDGDELYSKKYLQFIFDHPMPENALSGFTYGVECTELENGECWILGEEGRPVGLNRQAIISVDSKWSGQYPFESPSTYIPGDPTNYYWRSPDPSYHFKHLHQLNRSSKDAEVYLRKQKQYQFGLKDAPASIVPLEKWLNSREEYSDEVE